MELQKRKAKHAECILTQRTVGKALMAKDTMKMHGHTFLLPLTMQQRSEMGESCELTSAALREKSGIVRAQFQQGVSHFPLMRAQVIMSPDFAVINVLLLRYLTSCER